MLDWNDLADGALLSKGELQRVTAHWNARETTGYSEAVHFFDFESNGKPFTQVAVVLSPATPLTVDGKRVIVVASEGGHDNGREFFIDDMRREGPAPWLANRGVTFVSLTRLGRWNFLTDKPLGSWIDVPLNRRMPMFHRGQKAHWRESEYNVVGAEGVSSPTGSEFCRVPRPGSDLEGHMAALTPTTQLKGFAEAVNGLGLLQRRAESLLLYWGFSTGGAFLWPFAKQVTPDGIMGFGMSHFPFVHFATRAVRSDYRWLYDRSSMRLRERGMKDFAFFSPDLSPQEREVQFAEALHSPRFKSFEDNFMFFNVGALSETVSRLWNSSFLPTESRKRGFAELVRENIDLSYPDASLSSVAALELSGTRDEIQPPDTIRDAAAIVRPYCRRYKTVFLEGLHHSIAADQAPTFGSVWLDAITTGFYGRA